MLLCRVLVVEGSAPEVDPSQEDQLHLVGVLGVFHELPILLLVVGEFINFVHDLGIVFIKFVDLLEVFLPTVNLHEFIVLHYTLVQPGHENVGVASVRFVFDKVK